MNLKKILFILLIGITALSLTACGNNNLKAQQTVNVAAAASLAGVLKTLKPIAKDKANVDMLINAAASGTLAQQILKGAPVGLFISANTKWMDVLEKKEMILNQTRVSLVQNKLVVIAARSLKNPPKNLAQITNGKWKIAIGDPSYVPAGKYAKASLVKANLWDKVKKRIIPTVDVTAALVSVQTGAADLGFVYATDARGALSSGKYTIAFSVPDKLHKKIVYPATVIKGAKNKKAALKLLKFLQSKMASKIFKESGFLPASKSLTN